MDKLKHDELVTLYEDGILVDGDVYADQRSNTLLIAGEHYNKRTTREFFQRVRGTDRVTPDQKLRITKNHIQRLGKAYMSNILQYSPTTTCLPDNDKELQDIKAAELNNSVLKHIKKQVNFDARRREWAYDFYTQGEVACKITYDYTKGRMIGYEPEVDENGQPILDEFGQPIPSEIPAFSGAFKLQRWFGFNIFRAKEAQSWDDSPFIGYRSMIDKKELKAKYKNDPEKLKYLNESRDETYIIFDAQSSKYGESRKQVLFIEIYFRPCILYPNGYFYHYTKDGILDEGELPLGLFPIIIENCEEHPTSVRGMSPIKHQRPFQIEINRATSKVAEHQITIGDDKLVMANGSKLTDGVQLPGIRTMYTTGGAPVVIAGRTGDQYLNYISATVEEMYQAANMAEELQEKQQSQMDPYALLFQSLKKKSRYNQPIEKFGGFEKRVTEVILEMARVYLPDDEVIQMIGKKEQVNIQEFKNSKPLGYSIDVEDVSDDSETLMGKQLVFNHVLQYSSAQLGRDDIGKIIQNMPFAATEAFSDLTLDYENAVNDILLLDRGGTPVPTPGVNKEYLVKKLANRTKQADFIYLNPQIQRNYEGYIQTLQQAIAFEQAQMRAANADLIPANGFLTPCDFYVSDPNNPSSTHRARIPMDSLAWLVERLQQQGTALWQLEGAPQAVKSQIATQAHAMSQIVPRNVLGEARALDGIHTQGRVSEKTGMNQEARPLSGFPQTTGQAQMTGQQPNQGPNPIGAS